MSVEFSVPLSQNEEALNLTEVYVAENYKETNISTVEINSTGLELTGYLVFLVNKRYQVLGNTEFSYLGRYGPEAQKMVIDSIFSFGPPAVIISRDIEPSDGFLGDEAYMKLAHYIRLYKGARAVGTANGSHTISINESFAQWDTVEPAFYDSVGDVTHRNELAYAGYTTLVNQSGRNDFDTLKVAYDAENLYFYVKTIDNLTSPASENLMTLFIDADQNAKTGWNGYDYVLNRRLSSDSVGVLQKNVGNAWKWEVVVVFLFFDSGNEL